jgi:hypothetical protein
MLFEKIEKMRKAPRRERERFVMLATIVCVAGITVVWFLFTISRF